jgi:hypothetical protein
LDIGINELDSIDSRHLQTELEVRIIAMMMMTMMMIIKRRWRRELSMKKEK